MGGFSPVGLRPWQKYATATRTRCDREDSHVPSAWLGFLGAGLGFVSGSSGLIGELRIPEQKIAWSRRNLSFTGSEDWHVSILRAHVNARSVVIRNATPRSEVCRKQKRRRPIGKAFRQVEFGRIETEEDTKPSLGTCPFLHEEPSREDCVCVCPPKRIYFGCGAPSRGLALFPFFVYGSMNIFISRLNSLNLRSLFHIYSLMFKPMVPAFSSRCDNDFMIALGNSLEPPET